MINTAIIGEYKVMDILAICQKSKILWHLCALQCTYVGYFYARFFEFGLGSFSALCKISNVTIFLNLCSFLNFHPIHPNFIQGIIIIQAVTFWRSAKNCKKYGILKIFFTQNHMQLEFSISPTIFIGVHPNVVTTLATMVNLNAC